MIYIRKSDGARVNGNSLVAHEEYEPLVQPVEAKKEVKVEEKETVVEAVKKIVRRVTRKKK